MFLCSQGELDTHTPCFERAELSKEELSREASGVTVSDFPFVTSQPGRGGQSTGGLRTWRERRLKEDNSGAQRFLSNRKKPSIFSQPNTLIIEDI